jgi:aryl-alcohol dehydrogenase-like predicted oxidoreductase
MELNLPKIIFGTWGLVEWKGFSNEYCKDLCQSAYAKGMTSFDTAPVYGLGHAEEVLSTLPKTSFIATKIPARKKSSSLQEAYSAQWISQCVDESRKRLNRDALDLVQLHNWNYQWRMNESAEVLAEMNRLSEEGIVRNWGVSLPFEPPQQGSDIFNNGLLNSFQLHYNVLQKQNRSLIDLLKSKNKKVMLRSVLLHGFLLGSDNIPFRTKYGANVERLTKERDSFFSRIGKENMLDFCLNDAFGTGADSIILGITNKQQIEDIEKYLK